MIKTNYEKEKNKKLYLIIHPNSKQFYIHFTSAKDLQRTFSVHYSLNDWHTKKLFKEFRETIYPPEFYLLEETECILSTIYAKKIAWIRYFIEQNFNSLNAKDDIENAMDLFEETQIFYQEICDKKIEEIMQKDNRVFPNYGRNRKSDLFKNENNKKQVKFYCLPEEYKSIQLNAKSNQKTVSSYLRESGINQVILKINYQTIREHLKEIYHFKSEMNIIINMLVKTNQAYPVDIEKMIQLLNEMVKSEKQMLIDTRKERNYIRKEIKKMQKQYQMKGE